MDGIFSGATLGIFLLGFFNPWSESIGTIVGYMIGLAASSWCYIGSSFYAPLPEFARPLPTEVIGCQGYNNSFECFEDNSTRPWCPSNTIASDRPPIADFYSISFMYLGTLGLVVTVVVGSIVSAAVRKIRNDDYNQFPRDVHHPLIEKKLFDKEAEQEKINLF